MAAHSQAVRFGVKGGVPFGSPTADFGHLKIESSHWTVGPSIEFRLLEGISLEMDGLYSTYTTTYPSLPAEHATGPSQIIGTGHTRAWDFPAALKYAFRTERISPFLLGGLNYRRENSDVRGTCVTAGSACQAFNYATSQDRLGPVLGGGVQWNAARIRMSTEFRYTHLNRPGSNQYGLLFGITF